MFMMIQACELTSLIQYFLTDLDIIFCLLENPSTQFEKIQI